MDAVLFELVDGGGIAIDAGEISALWSGKEPGTTVIDRMGELPTVVVVGEYDKIVAHLFDSVDMRPKKKKKTTDIGWSPTVVDLVRSGRKNKA